MAWTRDQMAERAARELAGRFLCQSRHWHSDAWLPIIFPTGMSVQLQSENGMLGMGPFPYEGEEDADLDQCRQADDHPAANDQLFHRCRQFRR